jgi:thioredoxin-like negative regulator of GroEL
MFLPVFHEVGKANEETYITVNVDEQGEYANEMNVQGIPTIIVFKDGKEATRTAGFLSPEQLNELVNSVK